MDEIYLSVVIPSYNEEKRIGKTLDIIYEYLKKQDFTSEVIIVNDGSKDNTLDVIKEKYSLNNFQIISYSKNRGKGYAVRSGIKKSQGRYILFADADNSTPFEQVEKLLVEIKKGYDIVIGSRYISGGKIKKKQGLLRRFISRGGNLLFWLILGLKFKDTRCGFKLFKNKVAKHIFSLQKLERFGFDTEILVIANKYKCKVAEFPIIWYDETRSQISPVRDSLRSFKEIAQIKWNLITGKYNRNTEEQNN